MGINSGFKGLIRFNLRSNTFVEIVQETKNGPKDAAPLYLPLAQNVQ